MKVSINLVTWNGKKYLPYCLESIFAQTFKDFSLLILDNGSTDGTAEFLKNYKLQITNYKIIFNKENVGFAAGHNQVVKTAKSDYVLMLNQDIILEPDFLEVAVKFLDSHPEVAAVTGKILRWNFENNQKTNQLDSCGLKIFKNHRVIELGTGETDSEKWDRLCEVFGVSGAAPVYRRKALEDVAIPRYFGLSSTFFHGAQWSRDNDPLADEREYFDTDFFSYKEDVDLAYRLRLRGWQAWYLPEARAYHDRAARSVAGGDAEAARARKSKSKFVNYHSYKNHLFFLLKNVPAGVWLRYGHRIKWYEFKKIIYLLFFEPKTLRAWGEFFRKLPGMWKKRKWITARKKVGDAEIKRWLS